MTVLFALTGIGVVIAVAMLAVGRLGELAPVAPDRAPLDVPPGPLAADDVDAVRFAVGLRGYRMDEVDQVLDRVADDLAVRDARIAELEARLGERAAPSASSAGADLDAFAPPAPPEPPAPAAGTGPPGPLDAPLDAPAQADPEQSQP